MELITWFWKADLKFTPHSDLITATLAELKKKTLYFAKQVLLKQARNLKKQHIMLRAKETQQQMRNKVTEIWFCNPFHTDISEAFETSASHSESDCPQMEKT